MYSCRPTSFLLTSSVIRLLPSSSEMSDHEPLDDEEGAVWSPFTCVGLRPLTNICFVGAGGSGLTPPFIPTIGTRLRPTAVGSGM